MASNAYFNTLVSVNDIFYASHSDLLDRICMRLGAEDRADELREELLDNKFKLKAKKDPNKPKRSANAYTFFSREYRDDYKKKTNGAKINFTEMNKTLGNNLNFLYYSVFLKIPKQLFYQIYLIVYLLVHSHYMRLTTVENMSHHEHIII